MQHPMITTLLLAIVLLALGIVILMIKAFAARIAKEAGEEIDNRLRRAYELAYSRPPRPEELKILHAAIETKSSDPGAWLVLCQALLGANEFLYSQ